MERRAALAAITALAVAACTKKGKAPSAGPHSPEEAARTERERTGDWRELTWEPGPNAPDGERALVLVPEAAADKPLLVALHGRGESGNGLTIGARAWPYEYELDRILKRLARPPLTPPDLLEIVDGKRLAALNASLAAHPYLGMTVACPYAPWEPDQAKPFASFVVDELLPRARSLGKAKPARELTGIDGVSMGGRLALMVGLAHPETFGHVGALQPAVRVDEAPMWSELAQEAMKKAPLKLRLLTSDEDVFREPVTAIAARLEKDGVPHELVVIPGEHGYPFNRGPGGVEMLLWHERVARGLPPI